MKLDDKITTPEQVIQVMRDSGIGPEFHRYLSETYGPLSEDNFWRWREFLRMRFFATSGYQPLTAELNRYFATDSADEMHYPHRSTKDPLAISFTPNEKYGKEDRRVTMKPGRFLTKYYNERWSPDSVKEITSMFMDAYTEPELHLVTSEADIIDIYQRGPNSCMSKRFSYDSNPVRVYANVPGLALAYITRADGGISARTLVRFNPENNNPIGYVRIYGDETRMRKALKLAGYTHTANLEGLKLNKIGYWRGTDYIVDKASPETAKYAPYHLIPYLDGGTQYYSSDKDYLIPTSSRAYHVGNHTNQYARNINTAECQYCGTLFHDFFIRKMHNIQICALCTAAEVHKGNIAEVYLRGGDHTVLHKHQGVSGLRVYGDAFYSDDALQEHGLFYHQSLAKVISKNDPSLATCAATGQTALKTDMFMFEDKYYMKLSTELGERYINTKTGRIYKGTPRTVGDHIITISDMAKQLIAEFEFPIYRAELLTMYPAFRDKKHEVFVRALLSSILKLAAKPQQTRAA